MCYSETPTEGEVARAQVTLIFSEARRMLETELRRVQEARVQLRLADMYDRQRWLDNVTMAASIVDVRV